MACFGQTEACHVSVLAHFERHRHDDHHVPPISRGRIHRAGEFHEECRVIPLPEQASSISSPHSAAGSFKPNTFPSLEKTSPLQSQLASISDNDSIAALDRRL